MKLLISLIIVLSSCTILKARPAKNSGFLPMPKDLVEMREKTPFNRSWFSSSFPDYQAKNNCIYIENINSDYLFNQLDMKINHNIDYKEEVEQIAIFLKNVLRNNLNKYPNQLFKIAEENSCFKLKLAIVELKPTKNTANIFTTVIGFFVPGTGILKTFTSGSIAIEGFLVNQKTNEIIFKFADRESDKSAPFTVKDFQKYAHTRTSIIDWANQITELLNSDKKHKVEDSYPFELLPY